MVLLYNLLFSLTIRNVRSEVQMGTTKQKILAFIQEYIEDNNYSPTQREISEAVGLASAATTNGHLADLKKAGYIDYIPGFPRTIRVLKK